MESQKLTCEHIKTKVTQATKNIGRLTFDYEARCCIECGNALWSQDTEEKFHTWLGEQRRVNPDKFVIQKVALSSSLVAFANELALRNHSTENAVYQTCLSLYFVLGAFRKPLMETIDAIVPRFEGPRVPKQFQISPKIFVKINSNARLFDLDMNEVASWVIERVLWAAKCDIEETLIELEYALAV